MAFIKTLAVATVIIISLWIAGFVAFAGSVLIMHPEKTDLHTDAVVVLTGGDQRIETGLALFAAGKSPQLFITGVHPQTSKEEVIEEKWLGPAPLPPCCITLGHEATTTIENGIETREWLAGKDFKSIRLITSDYHMNRAIVEMHHALPGINILRNPIRQPGITFRDRHFWELVFSEYHKTLFRMASLALGIPDSIANRKLS